MAVTPYYDKYVPHMNRIAKAVGIVLDFSIENTAEGYLFNGHTVAAGNEDILTDVNGGKDSRGLLHEIAHFIVASPGDRIRPNYGLGPADFTKESGTLKENPLSLDEECLACVTEIELARHIFGDDYANDVTKRTSSDVVHPLMDVRELCRRGVLTSDGRLSNPFTKFPKWC